jgi:hypothetical protein
VSSIRALFSSNRVSQIIVRWRYIETTKKKKKAAARRPERREIWLRRGLKKGVLPFRPCDVQRDAHGTPERGERRERKQIF